MPASLSVYVVTFYLVVSNLGSVASVASLSPPANVLIGKMTEEILQRVVS